MLREEFESRMIDINYEPTKSRPPPTPSSTFRCPRGHRSSRGAPKPRIRNPMLGEALGIAQERMVQGLSHAARAPRKRPNLQNVFFVLKRPRSQNPC